MIIISDDSTAVCCCCVLILIIFGFFFFTGSSSTSSDDNISINISDEYSVNSSEYNLTNASMNLDNIVFYYFDYNTSNYNGTYGLNYSTVYDSANNITYLLDYTETYALANITNRTFKYNDSFSITYENRNDTSSFNDTGAYYVHELRYNDNTIIKELNNDTRSAPVCNFKTDNFIFMYSDDEGNYYNTTTYQGDYKLWRGCANNSVDGQRYEFSDEAIIGLAYASNGTFDFRYGFNVISPNYNDNTNYSEPSYYYVNRVEYPNGDSIKSFNIHTKYLSESQKAFITDYDERIEDVRYQDTLKEIRNAGDEISDSVYESTYKSKNNNKYSYYSGYSSRYGRSYGVVYSP